MTQRTTVDWWAFRTQGQPLDVLDACRNAYGSIGEHLRLVPRKTGWQGYQQSAELCLADMSLGLVAYGGEAQRGWVFASLTGKACQWIEDWDRAQEAIEALPAYDARRVDIALTTADRSKVSHEAVIGAYRAGGFSAGGRPPTCRQVLGEDPRDGRTVYVGNRERDKFFRGYEKGYELARGLLDKGMEVTHVDGVPIADMYRLELELKAKTTSLPADLIERRDQYFAGSYPYLQTVLCEVEPEILVMRRERQPQIDLARLLGTIQHQYGSSLFTALVAHHGDIGAVWSKIVGGQHNQALLRAGVLLVEHD